MEIDRMIIEGAQGFTYTGDQDRYDECEMAINETLKSIKRIAHRLKVWAYMCIKDGSTSSYTIYI